VTRLAALAVCALAGGAHADELAKVPATSLCVTKGHVTAGADGQGHVTETKMRAVVPGSDGSRVEMRFVYEGPTSETARLGSGELRRQVGLKLRAQDGCNLVYVMWRIDPKPQVVVSIKRNPGQRVHAQCGNRGYTNLRGVGAQPRPLVVGEPRTLKAEIVGQRLKGWADDQLAWEGDLGADASALIGPVGVRSDNARWQFALKAAHGTAGLGCGPGFDED
jgi:hypothetical protein